LRGDGARPDGIVDERIGVVGVKVLLRVERRADREDLLLTDLPSRP
jgi:hypothetical protein